MHEACRSNSPEKAAILIRKGVEVERKVEGQEGMNEGALVEKYLEKNENSDGEMPITSLVNNLEGDQVTSFLKKMNTEMDIVVFVGKHENTLLDLDKATFKKIVEEPAFPALINRQNAIGSTLLHEACRNNFPEKAAILIRKGVEVERKVEGQERMNEGDLVGKYLEKNENRDGEMPMTSLVKFLEEDEVRTFLDKMTTEISDVAKSKFTGMKNRGGLNPFQLACVKRHWKRAISLHALGHCQSEEDQGKEIDQILSERSRGIVHVVEHPALEPLLEEWAAAASENEKEAAEKKIDDIFDDVDVKVLFIQVGDSKGEQLSGVVKEWNCGRNNKVLLLPSNTTTSGNNWSDRHLVANGQPLTGIKVKKNSIGDICRIKARYGETWAEQFRKINYSNDYGGEETLDLRDTESITSINGCSEDEYGWILSLQAETTTGTSWGPVGDHQPDDNFSLRPSPRGKIKLAFISGREDEMYDNYCLRFHWIPKDNDNIETKKHHLQYD